VENKKHIEKQIRKFFKILKPLVPLDDYVIDFGINLEKDSIYAIELNPWSEASSSGLFDWEKDKPILFGEKSFEFRIISKPIPGALEMVSLPLRFLLFSIRPPDSIEENTKCEKLLVQFFGVKKKYKPLFKQHTSKYRLCKLETPLLLDQIFKELVTPKGKHFVYWKATKELLNTLGLKNKKLTSSTEDYTHKRHVFPTLMVLCLFEVLVNSKNYEKDKINWCNVALKGYLFLLDLLPGSSEELFIQASNVCVFLKNECGVLELK